MASNPQNTAQLEEWIKESFEDRQIRNGFIRTVYMILTLQLAVTIAVVCCVLYIEPLRYFVMTNNYFWWICFGVSLVSIFIITCFAGLRKHPIVGVIFLALITGTESFLVAGVTCRYDTYSVLIAAGTTLAVCVGITLFAMQTKCDFTMCGGLLLVLGIVMLVMGILTIFLYNIILHLVYASMGAIIFSFYLIYDTQMMLGGNHKFSIEPDEHILAALHLYLDVVMIFLYILQIVGIINE